MEDVTEQRRLSLAGHFSGKVEEMAYQLEQLVDACDSALDRFYREHTATEADERKARFSFSAFANVLQAFKDIAPTFLGVEDFAHGVKALRYGPFVLDSRNAMCHDGHPIVNAWVDGRYYVPENIVRLAWAKPITIEAPKEDIRTVALEFTTDLCVYLGRLVEAQSKREDREKPIVDIRRIEERLAALPLAPQLAQELSEMFAANRAAISATLTAHAPDFHVDALKSIAALHGYCKAKMRQEAPQGATSGNLNAP